jgi:hypothetical protein
MKGEKINKELKTLDGNAFLVKQIGETIYAISQGQVIAAGEKKSRVIEMAQAYKSVTPKVKSHVNIGMLSILQISAAIDNGTITLDQVKEYFEKNYKEDIEWLKATLRKYLTQFARAKYFDKKLNFKQSIFFGKFQNEAKTYLGYETYFNLNKYIVADKYEEMEKYAVRKQREDLNALKEEA